MTVSFALAVLWALVASLLAMVAGRDYYRRRAFSLIAAGIPILGFVTLQHGPWIGMLMLAGGMVVLSWPVTSLGHFLRRRLHLKRTQM